MDIAEKQASEAIYWTYPKSAEQKDIEMERMKQRSKKDKSQSSTSYLTGRLKMEELKK